MQQLLFFLLFLQYINLLFLFVASTDTETDVVLYSNKFTTDANVTLLDLFCFHGLVIVVVVGVDDDNGVDDVVVAEFDTNSFEMSLQAS
mmetsp:Transcript_31222/g.47805  ORF Transcript_31222/g.47805 Transcript_31222/m.47805 type:complete len:89 (+) Transcript_31222:117-383(+)